MALCRIRLMSLAVIVAANEVVAPRQLRIRINVPERPEEPPVVRPLVERFAALDPDADESLQVPDEWIFYRLGDVIKFHNDASVTEVLQGGAPGSIAQMYVAATERRLDWVALAGVVHAKMGDLGALHLESLGCGPSLAHEVVSGRVAVVQVRLGDAVQARYIQHGEHVYFYGDADAYRRIATALRREGVDKVLLCSSYHKGRVHEYDLERTQTYLRHLKQILPDARLMSGRSPDDDFVMLTAAQRIAPPKESGYVMAAMIVKMLNAPVLMEQGSSRIGRSKPGSPPASRKMEDLAPQMPESLRDQPSLAAMPPYPAQENGEPYKLGLAFAFPKMQAVEIFKRTPVDLRGVVYRKPRQASWREYRYQIEDLGMLDEATADATGLLATAKHTLYVHLRAASILRGPTQAVPAGPKHVDAILQKGYPPEAYAALAAGLTKRGIHSVVLVCSLGTFDELVDPADIILPLSAADAQRYVSKVAGVFRYAGQRVHLLTGRSMEADLALFAQVDYFVPAPMSGLSLFAYYMRTSKLPNLLEIA